MKPQRSKEFTTLRKLSKKVEDLEKRCEEIELILLFIVGEKKNDN
tara:strand:+ start:82 stop:216 length:135 start_codon:yes stop_codon:yes gene_type:complete